MTPMQADIVHYLRRSGWVAQSVAAVNDELPRWEIRLRSLGINEIPKLPSRSWSGAESRAHNHLNLLMRQAARERDAALEHNLRNLTAVRPYKP